MDEHLRRFVAARDRDDGALMRRCWEELVIDFFDRMDGLVYAAHRGRLDDDEHEVAVGMAMARFSTNLMTTFAGVSTGELVNACKTLARGICIDVQRRSVREHRHEGPSLTPADPGTAAVWEADAARARLEQAERRDDVRAFLEWALPQVKEERRRVLELTFHGAEVPEIAQELGITADNAYQRRSRGMKDLKRLREDYDT
ncbi:hypothetical protein FSW04_08175 [Baekduia soli]|uniref:RNA polymerase sigma factor 70 region 4 type 2 domain-containing protein n=1 Tax=Baekduia soli TaxID=496014 RepID=A0A5B8U3D2_9ACTN|nr:sigma factor-like helix-turn-helix DNA-binding protein [Baekduia soli]QEC47556.1 hypothetical protein FSW04_08175 [Baekduia soli]